MSQYKYIKKLGQGSFGSVWKSSKNGKIIALKQIILKDDKIKEMALKEVEFLKQISEPCIPSLACIYDYQI